ncbi:RagB/SusD family nutrient uptake outer membrane protein [Paraflavisolibacter sp. H34]|uniref:RagB/SusD family nutrient uptake outer membrane protein n=1 Tax=Huijunlia imazamoxiresistens TaxID=3127457 RepID=UPI003017FC3E
MKKLIYSLLALTVVSSCTKLDEEVYKNIASKDFYQSEEDLKTAMVSGYKYFQTAFGGGDVYNYFMIIEAASETGAPTRTKSNPHIYNSWGYANDPDNTINKWGDAYKIINQVNAVLGRGAGVEMDAVRKEQILGEAHFMRGLTYFHLLRLYGGVPIPESYTSDLNNLEIPRKTPDEVYDYIIADLKYAAEKLPKKAERAAGEKWRATRGAALALLGKVFLYRGSMTESAHKSAYFQESKKYSLEVINSGEYQLEEDFKNLWMWYNTANKHGKESIFEVEFGYVGVPGDVPNASRFHIDGGLNIQDKNFGSYMYYRYGPSLRTYNSFSDQDARKQATFLTSITLSTGQGISWVAADKGNHPGTQGWPSATPGNLKYYDRSEQSYTTGSPATNYYVTRFSEVLLNYAEAENELNGPGSEAYNKINQVRKRAKLPELKDGLSKEQFADSLYTERVHELIGEGQLYYDALRTGRLGKEVKAEVEYGVGNGLWLYSPLTFRPKKTFLWKIPTYDLNSSKALVQNPDNQSE